MNRSVARTSAIALTSSVTVLTLAACGDDGAGDGPTVTAAFYPLAYAAERVAGDSADAANLTSAGAEPHDLELTGRQVGELADADLVVYLHGFQPAVDEAVDQNASDKSLDVMDAVETIAAEDDHEHGDDDEGDHDHGESPTDPHVWLDPTNMIEIGFQIADRLSAEDPDNAETYEANAEALEQDLLDLDNEYRTGLAQCELDVFVTSHEAFGYLANRYDLEQVGISGVDPEAEPSPARMADALDVVADEGVTTVFYEPLVSAKAAETIADDLGVDAAVLDPIEGLSDDTSDEDYLSLMRANLSALREANGCS